MTNPYTWLKHTDTLTVLWILCFSSRKRHFLILKCNPIPHCPQCCTEMGHFQTHSMATQQPGSSGLAQDHRGGKWLHSRVLKWIRAHTPSHHRHSRTDDNTQGEETQTPQKTICWFVSTLVLSCLAFLLSSYQWAVERGDKEHGPGQTPASPWPVGLLNCLMYFD